MAYKKGETGNKAGRKTGIPNKRNVMANALIKYSEDNDIDAKQAVLSRIIDDAINGDSVSQKLILERLEPAYKTVIKPIELSLGDGDLFDKAEAIIDSISKETDYRISLCKKKVD